MIFGKSEKPDTAASKTAATAGPAASSAAAASATGTAAERQAATIRYIDRPELEETFADSVTALFFDGQTLRLEFAVTRLDDIKGITPITGRRYPACRVVLPPAAAVDLINRMQQIGAAMTQSGITRTTPRQNQGAAAKPG
jgi:hypothetical protein